MRPLDYALAACAIVFIVAVSVAVWAGARMWQLRERARDDLDPGFRRPTR